ncbi:MAG: hypothetical protein GY879_03325 [Planctomycetes bacterium]|nr:hypothetical protein [Planctomycetota bacterium]MCP4862236.1 hypothetical protein [Planctomycetota bacterium]
MQHADAENVRQTVMVNLSKATQGSFAYHPERGRFRNYLARMVQNAIHQHFSRPKQAHQRLATEMNATLIQELQGSVSFRQLGNTVCGPGDLNGDGTPDILVNGADGRTIPSDGLTALSGTDFQPIYALDRRELGHQVRDLDALGDVDQDGVITGYQENSAGNWFQGMSRVMSGATGNQIFKLTGHEFEDFGRSATALGDLDGDGVNDFATVSMLLNHGWQIRPLVEAFSGATGEEIGFAQSPTHSFFTVNLYPMSDLDNDGRDELAIGIAEQHLGGSNAGFLEGGELHILSYKQ